MEALSALTAGLGFAAATGLFLTLVATLGFATWLAGQRRRPA